MVELEVGDGQPELLECVVGEIVQMGVGDPERDIGVRRELVPERVHHLGEGGHALARHQDGVAVGLLQTTCARRYLPAYGTVQRGAHGQPQQSVQERGHGNTPQHRSSDGTNLL